MNHNKLSSNHAKQEARQSRPELTKRGKRALVGAGALILSGVTLGIGASLHEQSSSVRAGSITETEPDHTVTEIVLEDGAKLRSDPRITDSEFSNQLDTLDLGDASAITVPTKAGVHLESDENGNWWGVHTEDLSEVADLDLEADKDGVVWINEQRVSSK